MKLPKKTFLKVQAGIVAAFLAVSVQAEALKIGYSDWPGFTIFEIAKQKGWFKDAGLDVDLVWFDYLPSLDAFAAGKVDAVTAVATDAEPMGQRAKSSPFSITAMAAT